MDLPIRLIDQTILDPYVYNYSFENKFVQNATSSFLVLWASGALLYLASASISYWYFFMWKKHIYYPESAPQPFVGQVQMELTLAMVSAPCIAILTTPIALGEIYGYSKVYDDIEDHGSVYFFFSMVFFLIFTDTLIYWIHRWLHTFPSLYKYIHKPHHWWKVPTPYAAIAFHPLDGWAQSLPYHFFVFLFPMHRYAYLIMFMFLQLWTVSIHDGVKLTNIPYLNCAKHHAVHHARFKWNYGQYFTFWDKLMDTHRAPEGEYLVVLEHDD